MDLVETTSGVSAETARHPWELARLAVLQQLLDRYARRDEKALIVDVGCGDAFVAGSLADRCPDGTVVGVDSALTPTMIADAQARRPRSNLILSRTLDAVPPGRRAQAVLLMDVIEHVPDDSAFLIDLLRRDFVGPDTCFIVTVPAYQSLFSAHDVFLRHYRRYSVGSLRDAVGRSELQLVASGYVFLSLLPIRLAQLLKERLFGHEVAATGLTVPPSIGTGVMTRALIADASSCLWLRRLGITIPGLSAYAVCRRSA